MDPSALARIEKQRIELETNIAQLRKSLRHWQTLEIDYEGLKEEFMGLHADSNVEECLQAAKDFDADLVDEKELLAMLKDNNSRPRRPAQVVELLSKRVDYVARNIETVRKQLSDAEKRRNALLLAEEPDHRDDAGLPLAEITEELDDSGNVISSKVQTPGSDAPQLIDVLKKAGVDGLEETNGAITKAETPPQTAETDSDDDLGEINEDAVTRIPSKQSHAVTTTDNLATNPYDTEAEVKLRREMLEYSRGLDEVGAIVAELDLEEGGSDASYDEQDEIWELNSDMDEDEDFDEDASEDETGKSRTRLHVPREYRKRMEELQEKLGLQNLGPNADVRPSNDGAEQKPRPPAAEAARKAAIARHEKSSKSSLKTSDGNTSGEPATPHKPKPEKKKVAFSSELDIAPDSTAATPVDVPAPPSSNQMSGSEPPTKPISSDVVERATSKASSAPDPNDFSDEAHRREIALEYQRHRMKRIHSQEGGFLGNGEDDNYGEALTPLHPRSEEAEGHGKEKKVSRFKAARINR